MIAVYSWDGNPALEEKLYEAGMRYAILVGIVDPAEVELEHYVAEDILKYGHMRQTHEGHPVFDDVDAARFVSEIAGVSEEVGLEWIEHDWTPPEHAVAEAPGQTLH
jgi:hypothetical protein